MSTLPVEFCFTLCVVVGSAVNMMLPTAVEYRATGQDGKAGPGPTAGHMSPSGEEIIIKSYNDVFYWRRTLSTALSTTLQHNYTILPYILEPGGEAIAWDYQGLHQPPAGYFTLSEGANANLYYYPRKPSPATGDACPTPQSYIVLMSLCSLLHLNIYSC